MRNTFPINVKITCVGDEVQATIAPFSARVREGYVVEFRLDAASTVTAIDITKKHWYQLTWPFENRLPYNAKKGEPGKSGAMKGGHLNKRFGYNITTKCTFGGRETEIVIDPDMIIIL